MSNDPLSFYLKWDPKPPNHNQLCCQPSGNYRSMQMQHIVAFLQHQENIPEEYWLKKVEYLEGAQATRHTLHAPSPLTRWPLMSRFEVFEMNMTVISSGQGRHFSCARKTRYREQG